MRLRVSLGLLVLVLVAGVSSPVLGQNTHRVPLPGDALFPEGIAIHAETGEVFVGSVGEGVILRVADAEATVFADRNRQFASVQAQSIIGLAIDPVRHRLFAVSTPFLEEGAIVQDPTRLPQVLVLDTRSGRLLATLTPEGDGDPHFFNDVAVGPDGTAYVTDSYAPIVWRVDPELSAVTPWRWDEQFRTHPGFLLNGVAVTPDGAAVYVSSIGPVGGLWRLDTDGGKTTRVSVSGAFPGSDGLLFAGNRLLGIGTGAMEIELSPEGLSATVTAIDTPPLDLPTTLAWHENALWIVNSQMDHYLTPMFGDQGPPDPFWLTVVSWPGG